MYCLSEIKFDCMFKWFVVLSKCIYAKYTCSKAFKAFSRYRVCFVFVVVNNPIFVYVSSSRVLDSYRGKKVHPNFANQISSVCVWGGGGGGEEVPRYTHINS